MNFRTLSVVGIALGVSFSFVACGDDDDAMDAVAGSGGAPEMTGGSPADTGGAGAATGGSGAGDTLCAKYGGPSKVAALVPGILGAISADCRVNAFFALPVAKLNHIGECMVIQVSELFGCPGFTYEGSEDSKGAACRSMKASHVGLGISDADYGALVDDMAGALIAGGVEGADLASIAPALAGAKPDIVESDATTLSQAVCQGGGGAGGEGGALTGGGAGAGGAGGAN